MASYKQTCIHCGNLIDRDSRFVHSVPAKALLVTFAQLAASYRKGTTTLFRCGRKLYILCPHCGQQTFAGDQCERCVGL